MTQIDVHEVWTNKTQTITSTSPTNRDGTLGMGVAPYGGSTAEGVGALWVLHSNWGYQWQAAQISADARCN